jgi:hypothetical protein
MVVLEAQSGVPGRLPRQTNHRLKGTKRTRRQQATAGSSPISPARGWRARHDNYPKKVQVSDDQLAAVNLTPDPFHPEWNYLISPSPDPAG